MSSTGSARAGHNGGSVRHLERRAGEEGGKQKQQGERRLRLFPLEHRDETAEVEGTFTPSWRAAATDLHFSYIYDSLIMD